MFFDVVYYNDNDKEFCFMHAVRLATAGAVIKTKVRRTENILEAKKKCAICDGIGVTADDIIADG